MKPEEFEKLSKFTLAPFQKEVLRTYSKVEGGMVIAPTGSGKTLAVALPFFLDPKCAAPQKTLRLLWITPLRALSRDSFEALQRIAATTSFSGTLGIRTGDTSASQKQKQQRQLPAILVTTPESLHILFSYRGYEQQFKDLELVVVDEWHELYGSKRAVQAELGIARLKSLAPALKVWGMSATIPHAEKAMQALLPWSRNTKIVTAKSAKEIALIPLFPDSLERFPWAGHIGLRLLKKVLAVIERHKSVLVFTNTRSLTERWYSALLEANPELAGVLAIHHGSLDAKERSWVEAALHDGKLRVVVCTSSLDLGVDFSPVDAVVQIGSPKDASRIIQRAGRSGHAPGLKSVLYFVPTHSLEVIEFEALRRAVEEKIMGARTAIEMPLDVLCQYLVTLACGDGFSPATLLPEIRKTRAFANLQDEEWQWVLDFVIRGGETLKAYDEYKKVKIDGDCVVISSNDKAKRHRMAIGTIVSDPAVVVKFQRGKTIGSVEESFISRLRPGDIFLLGGRVLEYLRLREYVLTVRNVSASKIAIPRWGGGRMSLSGEYAAVLRDVLSDLQHDPFCIAEGLVAPLLEVQALWSHVPAGNELLIERMESREGHHLFIFPFEGRAVHEGFAMIVAERLSRLKPLTFSIAVNDYGIELLSDQEIPFTIEAATEIFSKQNVEKDCVAAMNASELARRKFKEIARVSGLTFAGYPGRKKTEKYVMASAQLIFDVFTKYDPGNLLIAQAYREALSQQLQSDRTGKLFAELETRKLIVTRPPRFTPFAFPLVVDRLREKVSSEKLEQRIQRLLEENNRVLKKDGIAVSA